MAGYDLSTDASEPWRATPTSQLAYVPFYASWLSGIDAQFIALRYFAFDGTDHPIQDAQSRLIRRYISWRTATPQPRPT